MQALLSQLLPQHQPSFELNMNALHCVTKNISALLSQTTLPQSVRAHAKVSVTSCQRTVSPLYQRLLGINHLTQQKRLLTHN